MAFPPAFERNIATYVFIAIAASSAGMYQYYVYAVCNPEVCSDHRDMYMQVRGASVCDRSVVYVTKFCPRTGALSVSGGIYLPSVVRGKLLMNNELWRTLVKGHRLGIRTRETQAGRTGHAYLLF